MITKQQLQETMRKDFPKFNILGWKVTNERYNNDLWVAFAFDGRTKLSNPDGLVAGEEFDILITFTKCKTNLQILDEAINAITYAYAYET